MNLDEYMWRNSVSCEEICKKTGLGRTTISKIKNKKAEVSLITAAKIYFFSKGAVSYESLLSEKQKDLLEEMFL